MALGEQAGDRHPDLLVLPAHHGVDVRDEGLHGRTDVSHHDAECMALSRHRAISPPDGPAASIGVRHRRWRCKVSDTLGVAGPGRVVMWVSDTVGGDVRCPTPGWRCEVSDTLMSLGRVAW